VSNSELIPSIIAAAVAAAGPKGSNDAQWRAKVNEAIPFVVSMIGEGSRQWKIAEQMLEAQVFTATYLGHVVEESSTRCVVTLGTRESKRYPDGREPIRTHRTDGALGRAMAERLSKLSEGDEIVVWKAMETAQASDGDDIKVRVLAHFETRPAFSKSQGSERQPAPVKSPPVRDTASGEPEGRAAEDESPLSSRFNGLSAKVKAKVARRLREEGIGFPEPGPERADRFIIIINEEESNE